MKYLALLLFLQASLAESVEQYSLFHSPRSMGRGGTFVAAFDSDQSSRLNPATLGESKTTYQLRGIEIEGFVGENVVNTISDIIASVNGSGGFGFIDKLEKKFGERHYGKTQWGILSQRFGGVELAPFALGETYLELHNPILPDFGGKFDSVLGINLSYGFELASSLYLGVTIRPLYRYYLNGKIGFIDIMNFIPQDSTAKTSDYIKLVSGFGVGVDIGTIWTPSKEFRLGLLVQNVGDTEYFQSFGSEPPVIPQKISAGMLYRYDIGSWHWDLLGDVQGILNREGLNVLRLTHFGTEFGRSFFGFDNDVGIVMGINEGYFGGGFFLDIWIGRFQYENYAVEVGHRPGQDQDRRIAFSFSLKLTF